MSDYTIEDKIDYIYTELKAQKRSRISKIIFKSIFVLLAIYVYFNFIQGMDKEKIMEKFSSTISEIAAPITQNIVNDMMKNNNESKSISKELIKKLENNPELLNKFK